MISSKTNLISIQLPCNPSSPTFLNQVPLRPRFRAVMKATRHTTLANNDLHIHIPIGCHVCGSRPRSAIGRVWSSPAVGAGPKKH